MIKEFFRALLKNVVTYFAFVGSVVTILVVKGEITIETRWLIIAGIILFTIVVTSFWYAHKKSSNPRFTVKGYDNEEELFYIPYTNMLPEDTYVTIYYDKGGSKSICLGRVRESEEMVSIEIVPKTTIYDRDKFLNEIKTTAPTILQHVYVRALVKGESIRKLIEQKVANKNGSTIP